MFSGRNRHEGTRFEQATVNIGWLLNPDLKPLLEQGAPVLLAVVTAIIFVESGLLVGFFLPGDSLLFSAGLLVALAGRPNLGLLILMCFLGAALGDQTGYMIGARIGPALFTRPNSRMFKQENVVKAHLFFERHGARALILARFVPVVRTFTPVLAGVSGMRYRTFVTFNVVGGALWSTLGILLGYGLGKRFPGIERYLTPVLLVIVLVSFMPVLLEVRKAKAHAGPGS